MVLTVHVRQCGLCLEHLSQWVWPCLLHNRCARALPCSWNLPGRLQRPTAEAFGDYLVSMPSFPQGPSWLVCHCVLGCAHQLPRPTPHTFMEVLPVAISRVLRIFRCVALLATLDRKFLLLLCAWSPRPLLLGRRCVHDTCASSVPSTSARVRYDPPVPEVLRLSFITFRLCRQYAQYHRPWWSTSFLCLWCYA